MHRLIHLSSCRLLGVYIPLSVDIIWIFLIDLSYYSLILQNLKRDFDKEEPNLERIYVQFPKLLKDLGIKVDPVEERFKKVKEDFYRTRADLHAFSELVDKQVSEANNFRLILDDLKEWIPKMNGGYISGALRIEAADYTI